MTENVAFFYPKVQDFLSNTSSSEKAVKFTETLVASVETESVLSEQDIFQSTKLMKAASNAKPKNSTDAKKIIQVSNKHDGLGLCMIL